MTVTRGDLGGLSPLCRARGGRVPSILVVGSTALGAATYLWATSFPGGSLLLVVGAIWAWVAAGVGWLLPVGSRVFGRSRFQPRPRYVGCHRGPHLGPVGTTTGSHAEWQVGEGPELDVAVGMGEPDGARVGWVDMKPDAVTAIPGVDCGFGELGVGLERSGDSG